MALIVFNVEPGPIDATLGDPAASSIPVAAVEANVARSLLARGRTVLELEIRTEERPASSENVIADTHRDGPVLAGGALTWTRSWRVPGSTTTAAASQRC